jgi:DNA-binding NtrC family response regulator
LEGAADAAAGGRGSFDLLTGGRFRASAVLRLEYAAGVNSAPRVLIVDYQSVIADTLVLIFAREGYEARAFYDAETALAAAEEWIPDLAVVEIILRHMNGLECAMRLCAKHPLCGIILTSAQVSADLVHLAQRQNYEFVWKPVHPPVLLKLAGRLLGREPEESAGRQLQH